MFLVKANVFSFCRTGAADRSQILSRFFSIADLLRKLKNEGANNYGLENKVPVKSSPPLFAGTSFQPTSSKSSAPKLSLADLIRQANVSAKQKDDFVENSKVVPTTSLIPNKADDRN